MAETTDRLARRKKQLVTCAVVLLVSTGLCGLNLKLFFMDSGSGSGFLWVTAFAESVGMLIGFLGVIASLVGLTIDWIKIRKDR